MAEDDKIGIPGDVIQSNSSLDRDPEILAEEKKNRIWHLKLERWKEVAKTIAFFLQMFKAETLSLVSGIGTLVVGWFQIRKWLLQGKAEVKGTASAVTMRQEARADSTASAGSGPRHLSTKHAHHSHPTPTYETMETPPPPGGDLMPPSADTSIAKSSLTDPMAYLMVALPMVFIVSTVKSWIKRKKKMSETQGGK